MQVFARLIPQTSEGRRQLAVVGVLLAFALVVVIVTSIVLTALSEVARYANVLDDSRSRETTAGALTTFRHQLQATLNDYAAWDDAARHIYAPGGKDWMASNYGVAVNSNLFDTAVVIDARKTVEMAYHEGQELTIPVERYFDPSVWRLLDEARDAAADRKPQSTGFVRTRDGVAAVGIALIRMEDGTLRLPKEEGRYLILARHLSASRVAELAQVYVINGLRFTAEETAPALSVPIADPAGSVLARLVWTPRAPGDLSVDAVRSQVLIAIGIVGCFFLALLLIGVVAMRRLKEDEMRAQRLAMHDRLSGLLNRAGFYAGLEKMIATANDDKSDVLLLYLDLDGFKEVNDTYGHGTGDQLIRGVAAGLKILMPQNAMLARIGGDEFAIALATKGIDAFAAVLGDTILEFFAEPLTIGERVATVGASIGVSTSPSGLVACDEALRRADLAMYKAKESGRGRIVAYDPAMDADREQRNAMEVDLRKAIETEALHVAYQPVVSAEDRRIVGVEALVRWNRPGHGAVGPDVFIPIAETTGLIDSLGLFVLRKACRQILEWPGLHVAVNVSPGQFRNPAFTQNVAAIIGEMGVDPSRITLEVTEGYFIQNPARARWTIDNLKTLGVKIALDDFGSGFSSVGYLRQFGFDRMKIDKSLVAALNEGAGARNLLQATVALARALDIPVTAEGIEQDDQATALQLCGCDQLQGYYFGRPTSAREIGERLEREAQRAGQVAAA